jgi:gliotoxin/aspirochlorine biosynthesis O-methyltransferase
MSLEKTLTGLEATLETFLSALRHEDTKVQLQKALHDDRGLPDKQASSAAARVVDRLGEIQHLLEPAHLILADHFLGLSNQCP